jgi:hypothetical protein
MDSLFNSFLVTVVANVVSYYICKWLDSHRKGKQAQKNPLGVAFRGGSLLVSK